MTSLVTKLNDKNYDTYHKDQNEIILIHVFFCIVLVLFPSKSLTPHLIKAPEKFSRYTKMNSTIIYRINFIFCIKQ